MADTHAKGHSYHLVDPSPWPFVGSISALVLTGGLVMYMHEVTVWVAVIGFIMVLYTMLRWWQDVTKEAEQQGHHTSIVQLGLRYGMMLFIASEVMFFVAWFWAYYNAALFPTEQMGGTWPPEGIVTFDPWSLPFLNTIILLTSSTTVTWAHHALRHGDYRGLKRGLWLTILLGIVFSIVQAIEYSEAAFSFTGGIYGSTFFMATGFHGFHVIVGTIFLIVCLVRAYLGHFKPNQHFGLEAAAWYWHFVDVVWIFLFCSIYWYGAGSVVH
jgi:cytochrome c oxidase subunit 3